jgi:glutamate racemase
MKIGIFDSGYGGLSVLHSAFCKIDAEFIYYADEKHVPYGEKSRDEILCFVHEIVEFLREKGVDAIIIACNSASSVFNYFERAKIALPIIAMEPAVKLALDQYGANLVSFKNISTSNLADNLRADLSKNLPANQVQILEQILVCATQITINGEKLRLLMESLNIKAQLLALGGLVKIAENAKFSGNFSANEYLKQFQTQIKRAKILVLGCTHFNYFKSEFLKINGDLIFVDGNLGTLKQLLRMVDCTSNLEQISRDNQDELRDFRAFDFDELRACCEFYESGEILSAQEIQRLKIYFDRLDIEREI